jgi:hypothetical protein
MGCAKVYGLAVRIVRGGRSIELGKWAKSSLVFGRAKQGICTLHKQLEKEMRQLYLVQYITENYIMITKIATYESPSPSKDVQ